ncbi:hypothetical protein LTR62_006526 [Meristemomyces frigidus]|uniref:Uncharacterized protein n=1 Tax=Meristemomyces frigidus TaxID=1508187 RepID=A0AAN7TBJ0_9PEZI|nr:hypothetical protein LTR62_006526 [Meristemomyces frigidus]
MRTFSLLSALVASATFATADPTFTKTIAFSEVTQTASSTPDCGPKTPVAADASCPPGCHLTPLTYGAAIPVYACNPIAAPTSLIARPIVAHMSCQTDNDEITKVVTPAYGHTWTTCATVAEGGATKYVSAVTLSVETQV